MQSFPTTLNAFQEETLYVGVENVKTISVSVTAGQVTGTFQEFSLDVCFNGRSLIKVQLSNFIGQYVVEMDFHQ